MSSKPPKRTTGRPIFLSGFMRAPAGRDRGATGTGKRSQLFEAVEPTGLVADVQRHWNEMRGERPLPALADMDFAALSRQRDYLLIFDVVPQGAGHPPRFKERLVGPGILALVGRSSGGAWVDEAVDPSVRAEIIAHLSAVVTTRRANCYAGSLIAADRKFYSYTRLLLPLSSTGKDVDAILGCAIPDQLT